MPNGDNNTYNFHWCTEKHKNIDEEFGSVWKKIEKLDYKLWGIMALLLVNAGGIIGVLIKM